MAKKFKHIAPGLALSLCLPLAWQSTLAAREPTPAKTAKTVTKADTTSTRAPTPAKPLPAMEDAAPQVEKMPAVKSRQPTLAAEPKQLGAKKNSETTVVRERHENTAVKIERHIAQDAEGNFYNQGAWTEWDVNGNLVGNGHYEGGERDGKWVRWFRGTEGTLFTSPAYKEFSRPFVSEATFKNGKLDGVVLISDSKNRKICEWSFKDNVRQGKSTWWYANGAKRREVNFVNGRIDGEVLEWSPTKALTTRDKFIDGRRLVTQTEYHSPNVKMVEKTVLLARDVVKEDFNWWEGSHTVKVTGKDGVNEKHGLFTRWHKNGQLAMEGAYDHDVPVGKFSWWYPNGQLQLEGHYVAGKQDGRYVWWHPNGLKQLEGTYAAGLQEGKWVRWNTDGRVVELGDYIAGVERSSSKKAVGPIIDEPGTLPVVETASPAPAGGTPSRFKR